MEKQKGRCNHLRHLRGAALSVYEFSRRLTARTEERIFFASNRTTADATGYSAETVSRAKASLVRAGFFTFLGGNRGSGGNGQWKPNRYTVVAHDEWAAAHPGQCPPSRGDRMAFLPSRSDTDTGDHRDGQDGGNRERFTSNDRARSNPSQSLSLKSEFISEERRTSPPNKYSSKGRVTKKKTRAGKPAAGVKNGKSKFDQLPVY